MKSGLIALLLALVSLSNLQAKTLDELVAYCEDCHGKGGISTESDVPTIAGFSDVAITDILTAYADDSRSAITSKYRFGDTSRPETDMTIIAKELTAEQIEQLAGYYSEKDFVAAKQSFDPQKAATGAKIHKVQCAKCHEEGGSSADDDVGLLAGQWTPYLQAAIKNFRTDVRDTEEKMLKLVKELSDQEIDALLNYWASQQ